MVKNIYTYGDNVLRQLTETICEGEGVLDIIQDLKDTLYKTEGVGLAGPQIGILKRIFVVEIPEENWERVFINPIIESADGKSIKIEEACLSIPGLSGYVSRPEKITISYFDEYRRFKTEKFEGIKSRIIQHEYDHLSGILWIDRVPEIHTKILPMLQEIKNKSRQ